MTYYFSKTKNVSFEKALEEVTAKLKGEGFGILTEIDVKGTLKNKLDVDFRKYKILGACNPPFAYKALQADDKIGTMPPCNVVVQEVSEGVIEIAAADPVVSMQSVANPRLAEVADQIQAKLRRVWRILRTTNEFKAWTCFKKGSRESEANHTLL